MTFALIFATFCLAVVGLEFPLGSISTNLFMHSNGNFMIKICKICLEESSKNRYCSPACQIKGMLVNNYNYRVRKREKANQN